MKERIETLVDSFVDDNGEHRNFVLAAISLTLPKNSYELGYLSVTPVSYQVTLDDGFSTEIQEEVVKVVKIGHAICNPTDKFDEELGKKIAIGRARKNSNCALYATQLGYINTKMVRAFLEQEAEYFKNNPQYLIAGYKREKKG